jgi:hypothetical protein
MGLLIHALHINLIRACTSHAPYKGIALLFLFPAGLITYRFHAGDQDA